MKAIIVDSSKAINKMHFVNINREFIKHGNYTETKDYIVGSLYPAIASYLESEIECFDHDVIYTLCLYYASIIYHDIATNTNNERRNTARVARLYIDLLMSDSEYGTSAEYKANAENTAQCLDDLVWGSIY
jgi:hypothetical protein